MVKGSSGGERGKKNGGGYVGGDQGENEEG